MSCAIRQGASGILVRDIQAALVRRGQRVKVDGLYGPKTATAVTRVLSRDHVTEEQGEGVLGVDMSLDYRLLNMVSCFEGAGWATGFGEYDAGILTVGPFGMTMGAGGSLYEFLRDLRDITPADDWKDVMRGSLAAQVIDSAISDDKNRAISRFRAAIPDRYRLPDEWTAALRSVMCLDGAKALMLRYFHDLYAQPAIDRADALKLAPGDSPGGDQRGYALMTDIYVQLGPLRLDEGTVLEKHLVPDYDRRLVQVAQAAEMMASQTWRSHVRERKQALAAGGGSYRGKVFALGDFGLVT